MEITKFAEVTYQVLQDTPLEKYIPTLCLPERGEIHALQGVPEEEEIRIREHALGWAESTAREDEEFLVAFRDGEGYFRIIRRAKGRLQEALYPGRKTA
jgi:hypothetical protein